MKILLDECTPRVVKKRLPQYFIRTAQEMGWAGIKNGKLLNLAEGQFEVLISTDQNLPYQQNLSGKKTSGDYFAQQQGSHCRPAYTRHRTSIADDSTGNIFRNPASIMKNLPLPRLDRHPELRHRLLQYCRLQPGEIWHDPAGKHRVGCLDAADSGHIQKLMAGEKATLAIHDPPYNLVAFDERELSEYIAWCKQWIENTETVLAENSSLYVWLGADQTAGFQPLPDFMIMMRGTPFRPRSFITMRNQRGYGTQKNWMAVRQELLYYIKGELAFNIEAEYTGIPKILRGYYKEVNGKITENVERGKSPNIRAGNVWVDIQQVFYRMEENVNGCYAQKPLKSIERIIRASSKKGDLVLDFFCHAGTTLLAAEILDRRCNTIDLDPIYCEIAIRRLERFRATGKTGWQNGNPFEQEISRDGELQLLLHQQEEMQDEEQRRVEIF